MLQEWHYYFQNTLRWRNLRKITIAQVHGTVYSAGLMLMWACDLIVAAEGTIFADVVGTRLGMCGMEYFAHPWEFGARKTKELMLTSDSITVEECYQLGMVSKVFPADDLAERTLEFARRIAKIPTMAALLIKESVNQTQDNQGFYNSLNACFTMHELNHSHWAVVHDDKMPGGQGRRGHPRVEGHQGASRRRRTPPPPRSDRSLAQAQLAVVPGDRRPTGVNFEHRRLDRVVRARCVGELRALGAEARVLLGRAWTRRCRARRCHRAGVTSACSITAQSSAHRSPRSTRNVARGSCSTCSTLRVRAGVRT